MHGLGTITRNAYAAGREAAHADNDGHDRVASAIIAAEIEANMRTPLGRELSPAFKAGYLAGHAEG